MKVFTYQISSVSGLLQNNPACMNQPDNDDEPVRKKVYEPEAEALMRVYKVGKAFFHPSIAFMRAMIGRGGGAKGYKLSLGKGTGSPRAAAGVIAGSCFNSETEFVLTDKSNKPLKKYELHTCRAVVNNAGIMRVRPHFPKWFGKLALEIDEELVTAKIIEKFLNIAGKLCGVGDYRPQCGGPFGRFTAKLI